MKIGVYVFDPTESDKLSSVRGVGRYLQLLKENFPGWTFTGNLGSKIYRQGSVFINPFFNFLQPPLTLKRLAPKQIAVIHDLIPLKYPSHFPTGIKGKINISLNKIALKNYELVITDSEASKKDIIDILGLPGNKIKVVYPCLPKSFTENASLDSSASPQNDIGSKYCLYVGDATWNKNLVNLVKAIKIINVTCIFVGKVFQTKDLNHHWQKELKEFLGLAKDDKRFVFAGYVNDSELIKLYQQATVNVLPSRDEGFGFSYLEGASLNCPSVLSKISVLKEISKGTASYVDPENPHDIADKIGEIYFNRDLKNTLGNKAYKRSQFFSAKKFKKDFLRTTDLVS